MWITQKGHIDMMFILLPGVFAFYLFHLWSGSLALLIGFFFIVIDAGHSYSTIWRTWLYPEEFNSHHRYWSIPLVIILFFFCWHFFQVPYMWSIVIYLTLYHYLKQNYGIVRWYQGLRGESFICNQNGINILTILAVLALHFKPDYPLKVFTENDLFMFPNSGLYEFVSILSMIVFFFWLIFNLKKYRGIKYGEQFFTIVTFALYSSHYWTNLTPIEYVMCLIAAHGIPYFMLMAQTLKKTQKRFNWRVPYILAFILICSLMLAFVESILESKQFIFSNYLIQDSDTFKSTVVALYLVPTLSHYFFDAFIWKRSHREAKYFLN